MYSGAHHSDTAYIIIQNRKPQRRVHNKFMAHAVATRSANVAAAGTGDVFQDPRKVLYRSPDLWSSECDARVFVWYHFPSSVLAVKKKKI